MRRLAVVVSLAFSIVTLGSAGPAAAGDHPIGLPSLRGEYDFKDIVVAESSGHVFLSSAAGFGVRDLSGNAVSNSLPSDAVDGMVLSQDGTTLYAAQPTDHAIAVVDTASLTLERSIPIGSTLTPRSITMVGTRLWFGYSGPNAQGGIGSVDLSQSPNTVVAPAPLSAPDGTSLSWYYAPALAASSAVPDVLFAADANSGPRPIERFTVSDTGLTLTTQVDSQHSPGIVADMTVSPDGNDLVVASNGQSVSKFRSSDLAPDGVVDAGTTVSAVASAPDDARLAVGTIPSGTTPAVYTFDADGTFRYQYAYSYGSGTAPHGLAFNAAGSTLYAVTEAFDDSGVWDFTLHVITDTHDTARPPAPEILTATPDYRAIDLDWYRLGLYDPAAVDTFTIYRGTSPTGLTRYDDVVSAHGGHQGYTDTAVTPGVQYYYAVTASNAGGESDPSPTASATRNDLAVVFTTHQFADQTTDDVDIAYTSDHGPTHRVTSVSGPYSDPAASPDGTSVAYSTPGPTGSHIWRMPLSGGAGRQLTSGAATDAWPTWSPDSTTIAFARTSAGVTSIWTVPATGGSPVQVPGTAGDSQPAWSPNGALLAVTHGTAAAAGVVVTSLDGTYRRAVLGTNGDLPRDKCFSTGSGGTYQTFCHYSGNGASWSPDGTELAFVQTTKGGRTAAIVSSVDGTVDYSLFAAFGTTDVVFWSPDGSRITESGGYGLVSQVRPDGTHGSTVSEYGAAHPSITAARAPFAPVVVPTAVSRTSALLADHGVTLGWTLPAGADHAIVRRSVANGPTPTSPADGVAVQPTSATTATVAGLTNGSTYHFAVFAASALDDISAPASVTAAPAATPRVSPTGSVLDALYRDGPAFTATWGSALPAGQVYDVQIGRRTQNTRTKAWSAAPTWTALQTGTTSVHGLVSAVAGTTYYLRARVRDSSGNTTAWSGYSLDPVPYDDRAATVSPGWVRSRAVGRFAGTVSSATRANAYLQLRSYGSTYTLITDRCSTCGQARVYLDGRLRATVDTYAARTATRQRIWSARLAGIGLHTVKVVVVGTRHRPAVKVDGLVALR